MSRLGASSEPESRHGFSSCSFSCPSFCLALKVPVRDEMFGAERRARVHAARSEAPLRQQRPPMTSPRPCLARSRRRVDCVLSAPYASLALLSLPHNLSLASYSSPFLSLPSFSCFLLALSASPLVASPFLLPFLLSLCAPLAFLRCFHSSLTPTFLPCLLSAVVRSVLVLPPFLPCLLFLVSSFLALTVVLRPSFLSLSLSLIILASPPLAFPILLPPSFLFRSPCFPPLLPFLPSIVLSSLSSFRRCSLRPCPSSLSSLSACPSIHSPSVSSRLSLPPSLPSFLIRALCYPPLLPSLPPILFCSLSPFRGRSFRPCPFSLSSVPACPCASLPRTYFNRCSSCAMPSRLMSAADMLLSPFRGCSFRPWHSSLSSMSACPCAPLPCTYCNRSPSCVLPSHLMPVADILLT